VVSPVAATATVTPPRESAYAQRERFRREGKPAPYDSEAT